MTNRKYTLKPDPNDSRDYKFKASTSELPASVDLRPLMSPIVDQGQLGSCTTNAIASGLREYMELRKGGPFTALSRLFLYWHERNLEGTVNEDSGAFIRDGMKVLQTIGCAPEKDYPYDITKFTQQPTPQAETDAAAFKIAEYHSIADFDTMLQALAEGLPVVLGISIYSSFESFDVSCGGVIPLPDTTKEKLLGGHAVLAVGYNPPGHESYVIVRNSWGTDWGDHGYCYIPKSYWEKGLVQAMWTGLDYYTPDNMPVDEAIKTITTTVDPGTKQPIFNDAQFWTDYMAKFNAGTLTNEDGQYVALAFQKFAAYIKNRG